MVRWYRSLFLRIFLWFWSVVFIAMFTAVLTGLWIEDDYLREATPSETLLLVRMIERQRPVMVEDRKLWRRIRPGWNLVAAPMDMVSQLPHDIEEFVDEAADRSQVLRGQNDGWLLVGPIRRGDYLYVAVSRIGWQSILEDEGRWMLPAAMVLVVTILCFVLAWSLTRPIRRLQYAVKQLGGGDFDMSALKVDGRRRDEIGALTNEVVDMAASLQRLLHSHQQLLRDVSHELRSPLTRLQIALGIARKKDTENRLGAEHARIERAVTQVDSLIGQMLDLARLQEQDQHQLQLSDGVVQEHLEQWLADADLEMAARQVSAAINWPAEPISAMWDWLLIERAFDNLLRNAIRFAPEGSALTISLQHQQDELVINIRDRGPGVPDDQLTRIFDAFTQVDTARDHAAGGYGIGLALVKRIAELHGGRVIATNAMPGLSVSLVIPIIFSEA
ncbi:MAG: ATP-binding protein [Thalassolituus sp.]|jgi:two-component system sensor histidine kinase CpxA|uniref:histidine kinase n=1 Tax=hydrothermal vent metagenome TaxID=652676 RepID=A0A160TDX2_9ZZZZ|nr:ATP-binding protein [Thalassolituus oleivorans]AHK17065.1 histidine kinase [Thalassolituus oleivorans R6-15]MDF1640668.1 ATP-binding protein [Thalassolituus oleivorans]